MIHITDKQDCCGCGACVQRCPRKCISMKEDEEGFLYPVADAALCIECGLCEKVCPVLHQEEGREPQAVFAAVNPDEEVRRQSSSGGVFSLLAEAVVAQGGAVFGARFGDDWTLEHACADTPAALVAFRGSKYLQSRTGDTFARAEALLKAGRKVLFSGTPCQIAGLRKYLRRDYENLLCVDFICHGVPSPGVFRSYLEEEKEKFARQGDGKNTVSSHPNPPVSERDAHVSAGGQVSVESISFRDKRLGWKKYSFALTLSKAKAAGEKNSVSLSYPLYAHAFLRGFLADLYLRPSCHRCPAKELSSGADITLGDFGGIRKLRRELDDDRGTSAVTANTPKGLSALRATAARLHEMPYADLRRFNPALCHSASVPPLRASFFASDGRSFHQKMDLLCPLTLKATLRRKVGEMLLKLGLR